MRPLLVLAVVVVGLLQCEQRFSSNPPVTPDSLAPAASSGALEALLSSPASDAGAVAAEASRAMIVTLCSASPLPCASADDASPEGSYRVVFGSGRAEIRSRGQAMADLYKELRDRIASGERLDAVPRAARSSGGAFAASGGASTKPNADGSDAAAQCAFHLLDLVDGVGEVTLEVAPRFGSTGCLVSLGRPGGDGGVPHCLVPEPGRPNRPKGS